MVQRPIIQFSLNLLLPPFYIFLSYRVKGMLMINVLAVAAGLLMGLCRMWKPHIMVISGRAVMGLYCGIVKHVITFEIFLDNLVGNTNGYELYIGEETH